LPRTRKHYRSPVDEKTIGARLRELRKRRGMTQLEVAEELGVRQALISQYEQGSIRIHGALIAALAKLLGASADELLGLGAIKANGHATDRRFLRRLEKIGKLSRRDQQVLLRNLDAFLKGAGVA
jgi:transcriptional regulator with XRE-family HTH domain